MSEDDVTEEHTDDDFKVMTDQAKLIYMLLDQLLGPVPYILVSKHHPDCPTDVVAKVADEAMAKSLLSEALLRLDDLPTPDKED